MPVFNHRRNGGMIMIHGNGTPALGLAVVSIRLLLLERLHRMAVVQLLTSTVPIIAVPAGYSVIWPKLRRLAGWANRPVAARLFADRKG